MTWGYTRKRSLKPGESALYFPENFRAKETKILSGLRP
jgi:hypothetical protein